MLLIPSIAQVDRFTIFGDDLLFNRFYALADGPKVRRGDDGEPVFLLVKYGHADETAPTGPGPRGGGYLTFDCHYGVEPAEQASIVAALRPRVNAEWQRLRAGTPAERAMRGVAGTTAPPAVELASPTYVDGRVALDAPQSTQLVTARVGEAKPSLLSDEAAVFSLDLTPEGATFLQRTLTDPAKPGHATGLAPLQVRYDLTFWARLPAVHVHVEADSSKVYDYLHKQMEGRGVDNCTTYDFDHTDVTEETLALSGAITVQIDTGSGSVPDEEVAALRAFALDLVKQAIGDNFFEDVPHESGPADAATPLPPGTTAKRLRTVHEAASMSLSMDIEQSSVVAWPIHPQTTLTQFLGDLSPAQLAEHVRTISLDDPFFAHLTVEARCICDWDATAVVQLELQYPPASDDRVTRAATFTKDDGAKPRTISVPLETSGRRYRYRTRFATPDGTLSEPSDWAAAESPSLIVALTAPGTAYASVQAGAIDFDQVKSVQVTMVYEDPAHAVAAVEDTVILTPTAQVAEYRREIGVPITGKLKARAEFVLANGNRELGPWQEVKGAQHFVNQPETRALHVNLVPTGAGWRDIGQVVVDLRHAAPTAGDRTGNFKLHSAAEFANWTVPLLKDESPDFEMRQLRVFKDGHSTEVPWTPFHGDQTLRIDIPRDGLHIAVLGDAVDWTRCQLVEVSLSCPAADPPAESFVLTGPGTQVWAPTLPIGASPRWGWKASYHLKGGGSFTHEASGLTGDLLVLPAITDADVPARVVVMGALVDYRQTPIVTVDLTYGRSGSAAAQFSGSLAEATPRLEWQPTAGADPTATYTATVTYFTPDGQPHPIPAHPLDAPRLVVPRYLPNPS